MYTVKIFYYLIFLAALVAFGLLASSIPTEYMVEAKVMDSDSNIIGFIHFGILRGTKSLNGKTIDFIGVQCHTPHGDIRRWIVCNHTVLNEHKGLYHPLVTYIILILTGFATICALIAAVLSLVNIVKLFPVKSVQGPIGMCFYNVTGVVLATTDIVILTSLLFGPLDEQVLSTDDQALGYSNGQLALGYTVWFQLAAVTLLGINIGLTILSQTFRDPEKEGNKGIPKLMKTAHKEDIL